MPLFAFRCEDCNNITETLKDYKDLKDVVCEHCKSKNVKMTFSTCNFVLKGSGFYQNDSKENK